MRNPVMTSTIFGSARCSSLLAPTIALASLLFAAGCSSHNDHPYRETRYEPVPAGYYAGPYVYGPPYYRERYYYDRPYYRDFHDDHDRADRFAADRRAEERREAARDFQRDLSGHEAHEAHEAHIEHELHHDHVEHVEH